MPYKKREGYKALEAVNSGSEVDRLRAIMQEVNTTRRIAADLGMGDVFDAVLAYENALAKGESRTPYRPPDVLLLLRNSSFVTD